MEMTTRLRKIKQQTKQKSHKKKEKINILISYFTLSIILMWIFMVFFTACSYNVSMIHSEGSTDTLEAEQTTDPVVSPSIQIPLKG